MGNANLGNILALKQYNKINLHTGIESASPHRLIQMLLEGALGKLAQAKGHMKLSDVAKKGEDVSMAISIIGGLRDSLDHEKGGEIAINLDSLYEYMTYRLMEANLKNDVAMLDEVYGLLMEIKSAWDAIAEQPAVAQVEKRLEQPAA
ncbi:MAG: B-type flagellar protein FliS [marine bacterium B5-7]|nr:MAG: B-type flagellar protein FliS [marine bacterium B5-7]